VRERWARTPEVCIRWTLVAPDAAIVELISSENAWQRGIRRSGMVSDGEKVRPE
jgi:hypothetical protein